VHQLPALQNLFCSVRLCTLSLDEGVAFLLDASKDLQLHPDANSDASRRDHSAGSSDIQRHPTVAAAANYSVLGDCFSIAAVENLRNHQHYSGAHFEKGLAQWYATSWGRSLNVDQIVAGLQSGDTQTLARAAVIPMEGVTWEVGNWEVGSWEGVTWEVGTWEVETWNFLFLARPAIGLECPDISAWQTPRQLALQSWSEA